MVVIKKLLINIRLTDDFCYKLFFSSEKSILLYTVFRSVIHPSLIHIVSNKYVVQIYLFILFIKLLFMNCIYLLYHRITNRQTEISIGIFFIFFFAKILLCKSSCLISLLSNQPKKNRSNLFNHHGPNLAESFGIPIGDMRYWHHTVAETVDAFADELPNISDELDVEVFDLCHHIAMDRRPFQADKMLI